MAEGRKTKKSAGAPTSKGKGGGRRWVNNVRYGRALSADLFLRNAWLLLVIVVTIISLIGLRYKTKTKMSQIKTLQTELERARSEKLRQKSEYMTLIRESEMKRLVNEKGLGLEFRDQPPYEVEMAE